MGSTSGHAQWGRELSVSDTPSFDPPEVTDEDIGWVSRLLKLPLDAFCGEDGTDSRQEVLKSMEQMDVAACPGSGKTTLLVAKLAILAEKWPYRTRGICVLSHTNGARNEIETRLGNTTVGRRLLSYPHHIGTIHGFVNEILALPWLRSQGYPIKMIDTNICLQRRWNALPFPTRSSLEKNHHDHSVLAVKSSNFSVGEVSWGKRNVLGTNTPTYCAIRDICRLSTAEGYFCYDEMFMWAGDLMDKVPGVVEVIRQRFPVLFIDEAQDNSEQQSAILHRIFIDGGGTVIRQRFGDENQAIFDSMRGKEATTDRFPGKIKKDLPNSHRFGQMIADLADPLGLIPHGLKGHGPKKTLDSGSPEGRHTIFVFDDDSAVKVLDAYGELLVETFSEPELREKTFTATAVGQIHTPPDEETNHKFPNHIGHYWADYNPELTRQDPKPPTFVQYIFVGMGRAETKGETYPTIEKIAEGILRLTGMAEGGKTLPHRRYSHRHVLELLEEHVHAGGGYKDLIARFVMKRETPTKETWDDHWRGVVREIAETIAGASLSNQEAKEFLAWKQGPDDLASPPVARKNRDNIYRYPNDDPKVHIHVGSIHSVKSETHAATLVMETFWYQHNLDSLTPWLDGSNSGGQSKGVHQQFRLKLHYVAMTRPTHLLCLAMKQSSLEDGNGALDHHAIQKLILRGLQVKRV